jgi:hypothetical protein
VYPFEVRDRARQLSASGASISEISRTTGASRAAVREWLRSRDKPLPRRAQCFRCLPPGSTDDPFPRLTRFAYAYLLGLYLGDGCLTLQRRGVYLLRIFLDRRYPLIVAEAHTATALSMPSSKARVQADARARMDVVRSSSKHWPCLFPQHGSGPKHQRSIVLQDWQREILEEHPFRFLRGLIHSDGSRHMNPAIHPSKTYWYPRYSFCNHSKDIRSLFCESCERVGVEWRQMNRWNISVARRDSVSKLDAHIGPKR